jgi:hypothetical protein
MGVFERLYQALFFEFVQLAFFNKLAQLQQGYLIIGKALFPANVIVHSFLGIGGDKIVLMAFGQH